MGEKSCVFMGHREANESVLQNLETCVERLICEEGVSYFYVGNHGGFDRLATTVVNNAKKKHPNIILQLVLPYHPAERPVELTPGFDGSYYPEGMESVPRRYAIVRANRKMVEACDWLVCFVRHGASNARNLLEYAKKREKKGLIQIENLAEKM